MLESVTAAPPDWNVTVGVPIVSLAVNDKVISLPTFAVVFTLLFDAIETLDNVGAVVSPLKLYVNVLESVLAKLRFVSLPLNVLALTCTVWLLPVWEKSVENIWTAPFKEPTVPPLFVISVIVKPDVLWIHKYDVEIVETVVLTPLSASWDTINIFGARPSLLIISLLLPVELKKFIPVVRFCVSVPAPSAVRSNCCPLFI